MPSFQTKTRPKPADVLAARPLRLFAAEPSETSAGQWRLTVPLKPAGWASRFLRVPSSATKTFELDDLGKLVWDGCDGKTEVRQIIRTLASRYDLNEREAEVSTLAFLKTLMGKGLVGIPVKDTK
ncbi:MAG: PqqD family protein [Tepidisphaeraceae bacterium]